MLDEGDMIPAGTLTLSDGTAFALGGRGKPLVVLHGRALARAQLLGLSEWAVSMSHSDHDAVAFVAAQ